MIMMITAAGVEWTLSALFVGDGGFPLIVQENLLKEMVDAELKVHVRWFGDKTEVASPCTDEG